MKGIATLKEMIKGDFLTNDIDLDEINKETNDRINQLKKDEGTLNKALYQHYYDIRYLCRLAKRYRIIEPAFLNMKVNHKEYGIVPRFVSAYVESKIHSGSIFRKEHRQIDHPFELIPNTNMHFLGHRKSALVLEPPPIPMDIKERLLSVLGDFKEVLLVWEANWDNATEIIDPILLGVYGECFFLLFQWDKSKTESYVISEF